MTTIRVTGFSCVVWATFLSFGLVLSTASFAGDARATGTVIMNDKFHTKDEWGNKLVLPKDGKITRVMDGTYGFDIKTEAGVQVASFLNPQDAVGMSLPAGTYLLDPYVCKRHRHHHIEVTATY
tara:strand:+ start:87657 stop:88028 length:372 start_codon:yes stop_codon:yes gene_type:complete